MLPIGVIHYKINRKFLRKRIGVEYLNIKERVKLRHMKKALERVINNANHVISIIDSIDRTSSGPRK